MKQGKREGNKVTIHRPIPEPTSTEADIHSKKSILTDSSDAPTVPYRPVDSDASSSFSSSDDGLDAARLLVHDFQNDFGHMPFMGPFSLEPSLSPTAVQQSHAEKKEKFIVEWLGEVKRANER